jgi:hypothetical protein
VGDIKPLEYNIQLFLDMAYNAEPFRQGEFLKEHLRNWYRQSTGCTEAGKLAAIMWDYYRLAFERRPEFMGWSQTEPTTEVKLSSYNHFQNGDEAARRIAAYERLENTTKELYKKLQGPNKDAFYQLVYYPVVCASLMNKKYLYRDKSYLYARQNRASASDYSDLSKGAHSAILKETNYFNHQLSGGKWNGIMSASPRNLPVFDLPVLKDSLFKPTGSWLISPEGYDTTQPRNQNAFSLPEMHESLGNRVFFDLYLTNKLPVQWEVKPSEKWIVVSKLKGNLLNEPGKREKRITVSINWDLLPEGQSATGQIFCTGAGTMYRLEVKAKRLEKALVTGYKGAFETNGYISFRATHFSQKNENGESQWKWMEGLGHQGSSLMAMPLNAKPIKLTGKEKANLTYAAYDFISLTKTAPLLTLFGLPMHELTNQYQFRCGVSIDEGPMQVVDFQTFGRSEEWKQNVLSNKASRTIKFGELSPGRHNVRIYLIDPGVILEQIEMDFGGLPKHYSYLPETWVGD